MWNPRCPVYDFYYKKVRLSSHPGTKVRIHGAPGAGVDPGFYMSDLSH